MWPRRRTVGSERYKIRARIGQGGQGEIYRASCDVVLKRLIRVQDPLHHQRLEREFEAARQIDHPNVIKMLDCDFGAEPFIVMEYLRGETLAARIARKRKQPLACIPLLLQAMQGVRELHARGLIHRDLKPANIFVRSDRDPELAVVLDLGAVRFLVRPEHHGVTTTGMSIGTPAYMAPEQAAGQPAAEAADIYSLGVTLYEILVGSLPGVVPGRAAHGSPVSTDPALEKALSRIARPPDWSSCRELDALRSGLIHVVTTAMAPDPESRYASVAAFALALERAVGMAESTIVPVHDASLEGGTASRPPLDGRSASGARQAAPTRAAGHARLAAFTLAPCAGMVSLALWFGVTPQPTLQADAERPRDERYARAIAVSSARPEGGAPPLLRGEKAGDAGAEAPRPAVPNHAHPTQALRRSSRAHDRAAGVPAESEDAIWERMKREMEQGRLMGTSLADRAAAKR